MDKGLECNYPGCKKEIFYTQNLRLINEKEASVDMNFCKYHYYIVMSGHFKARVIKLRKLTSFELVGPLREVEISEQVMGAREMTKLEDGNKTLKDN